MDSSPLGGSQSNEFKTRVDLLTGKLQAVVDPAEFASKWRDRTLCAPGFAIG
jgi:hypothetical protein